jgi:sulfur-carrier protein
VTLEVEGSVTQRSVLDALEARYPMLRGAIREHDLSHQSTDEPLPDAVVSGREPFIVIGAIAGG